MSVPKTRPIAETFQYCPRCSASGSEAGSNPFRCTDCEFTFYFSPITAVGAIIADDEGRVLLLTRGRDPGQGKYGLPGGFVDAGETLEVALAREVLEETNLTTVSTEYLASFPNSYDFLGCTFPVTDAFFVCSVASLEPIKPQENEISSYQFLHPTKSDLAHMAFASNRKALEKYLGSYGNQRP